MAFVGFATMNPIAMMSVLDSSKWRPVVYADTPRAKSRYQAFIAAKTKGSSRRPIVLLFGATNLHKVSKDLGRFHSVIVFDDVQNLHNLSQAIPGFDIADIEIDESGMAYPRNLSPSEIQAAVEKEGKPPSPMPFLTQVTAALGKRRPSVLETTSRMPVPEAAPESGAQRLLTEVKATLDALNHELDFAVVLDYYTKFLFRIVTRSQLTHTVTKKLPAEAKDHWEVALNLAASPIGDTMSKAFRALCVSTDPDYRVSHAVADFGLRAYAGDFVYFTAVLPPSSAFSFSGVDTDDVSLSTNAVFVPPAPVAKAKKRTKSKA